jgi:predicted signal transduction protein with EAL and GGDEF domain
VGTPAPPVHIRGGTGTVAASIGLALFPEHADTPTRLLSRADQAMYAAKEAGGGQTVSSGGARPAAPHPDQGRGRVGLDQDA